MVCVAIAAAVIGALFSAMLTFFLIGRPVAKTIDSFEECVAAGYPILETYPEQCKTPDGKSFTKKVADSPAPAPGNTEDYFGSSTYGSCNTAEDCITMGCNSEVCGAKAAGEGIVTTCQVPDKPTAKALGYSCGCVNNKCQWAK